MQQGENLEEEEEHPAPGVLMKKNHIVLLNSLEQTPLACFGSSNGNGVEHGGVDEDDDDEGCRSKAWRGRNSPLSLAKVWDSQQQDCSGF